MIIGSNNSNELYGEGGNDTIEADDFNDRLDGGSGVDTLIGGTGDDTYYNLTLTGTGTINGTGNSSDNIYNTVNGNGMLFFDRDGIGGNEQKQVATLLGAPTINHNDIFITSRSNVSWIPSDSESLLASL